MGNPEYHYFARGQIKPGSQVHCPWAGSILANPSRNAVASAQRRTRKVSPMADWLFKTPVKMSEVGQKPTPQHSIGLVPLWHKQTSQTLPTSQGVLFFAPSN